MTRGGCFAKKGSIYRPAGDPEKVRVHGGNLDMAQLAGLHGGG
jgi:hypothetical protein